MLQQCIQSKDKSLSRTTQTALSVWLYIYVSQGCVSQPSVLIRVGVSSRSGKWKRGHKSDDFNLASNANALTHLTKGTLSPISGFKFRALNPYVLANLGSVSRVMNLMSILTREKVLPLFQADLCQLDLLQLDYKSYAG